MADRILKSTLVLEDKTEKVLTGFRARVKAIAPQLLAAASAAAVLSAATATVRKGLDFRKQIETATVQFQSFFGSVADAETHVKRLIDFAANTPFQLPGLLRASRMLLTFGADAVYGSDTLKVLGDAAAGVSQPIEDVSVWVGRMYTNLQGGQPIGEATARLQEMGLLSGEARMELEQLAKEGGRTNDAMALLRDELSRHEGGMERLSKTTAGLESTFGDLIGQAAGLTVKILGLDDAYKATLETSNRLLQNFIKMADGNQYLQNAWTSMSRAQRRSYKDIVEYEKEWLKLIEAGADVGPVLQEVNDKTKDNSKKTAEASAEAKRLAEELAKLNKEFDDSIDNAVAMTAALNELNRAAGAFQLSDLPVAQIGGELESSIIEGIEGIGAGAERAGRVVGARTVEGLRDEVEKASTNMSKGTKIASMFGTSMVDLGNAIGGTEGKVISFAGSMTQAFAAGGPWAAGVAAAVGLFTFWRRKAEEERAAAEQLRKETEQTIREGQEKWTAMEDRIFGRPADEVIEDLDRANNVMRVQWNAIKDNAEALHNLGEIYSEARANGAELTAQQTELADAFDLSQTAASAASSIAQMYLSMERAAQSAYDKVKNGALAAGMTQEQAEAHAAKAAEAARQHEVAMAEWSFVRQSAIDAALLAIKQGNAKGAAEAAQKAAEHAVEAWRIAMDAMGEVDLPEMPTLTLPSFGGGGGRGGGGGGASAVSELDRLNERLGDLRNELLGLPTESQVESFNELRMAWESLNTDEQALAMQTYAERMYEAAQAGHELNEEEQRAADLWQDKIAGMEAAEEAARKLKNEQDEAARLAKKAIEEQERKWKRMVDSAVSSVRKLWEKYQSGGEDAIMQVAATEERTFIRRAAMEAALSAARSGGNARAAAVQAVSSARAAWGQAQSAVRTATGAVESVLGGPQQLNIVVRQDESGRWAASQTMRELRRGQVVRI